MWTGVSPKRIATRSVFSFLSSGFLRMSHYHVRATTAHTKFPVCFPLLRSCSPALTGLDFVNPCAISALMPVSPLMQLLVQAQHLPRDLPVARAP